MSLFKAPLTEIPVHSLPGASSGKPPRPPSSPSLTVHAAHTPFGRTLSAPAGSPRHPLFETHEVLRKSFSPQAIANLNAYGSISQLPPRLTKDPDSLAARRFKQYVFVGESLLLEKDGSLHDVFHRASLPDGVYYFSHKPAFSEKISHEDGPVTAGAGSGATDVPLNPALTLVGAVQPSVLSSAHPEICQKLFAEAETPCYLGAETFGGEFIIQNGKFVAWNSKSGSFKKADEAVLAHVSVFPAEKFIPWSVLDAFQEATTEKDTCGGQNYLTALRDARIVGREKWFAPHAASIIEALVAKNAGLAIRIATEHGVASHAPSPSRK